VVWQKESPPKLTLRFWWILLQNILFIKVRHFFLEKLTYNNKHVIFISENFILKNINIYEIKKKYTNYFMTHIIIHINLFYVLVYFMSPIS